MARFARLAKQNSTQLTRFNEILFVALMKKVVKHFIRPLQLKLYCNLKQKNNEVTNNACRLSFQPANRIYMGHAKVDLDARDKDPSIKHDGLFLIAPCRDLVHKG
jgi:hypothetical protein